MKVAVFVDSIASDDYRRPIVTASNGGQGGPPTAVWQVSMEEARDIYIGKKYTFTIEEDSE